MASTFTKLRHDLGDDLEAQVTRLQREVKSLRKELSKRGSAAYDDTSERAADVYDEVISRIGDAMPQIARQSRVVRKAATDNPVTTAVIGLALVGILAGLLSRR